MAKNDVVLLDALVEKAQPRLGSDLSPDETFELFALEQVLKERAVTYAELRSGWVDGGYDGGIDGFYTFVDDHLATIDEIPEAHRHSPSIDIVVCTSKHRESFQQAPLDQLHTSLAELLDLTRDDHELSYPYNTAVIDARTVFRQALLSNADRHFRFTARVVYACRGLTTSIGPDIRARASAIEALVPKLIRETQACGVDFIGASELLDLARRRPDYSLKLPFIETVLSRGKTNYVVLCRLSDYYKFVTDPDGHLRRYLFESNVRDYLGTKAAVNRDIASTLAEGARDESVDFWWLNNGVTFLASRAGTVGKDIYLDNVQIVNGLQTTETIYEWFRSLTPEQRDAENSGDDRAILIKIIVTDDQATLDRIIKASNYQNSVDAASLRATDKIQRDIEQFFEQRDWYYERRNSYWQNHDKPAERIVLPRELAKWVRCTALCDPLGAMSSKSKIFRNDQIYRRVFDPTWDLEVFWAAMTISRGVERVGRTEAMSVRSYERGYLSLGLPFSCYLYLALKLRRSKWGPEEIIEPAKHFDAAVAMQALVSVSSHMAMAVAQRPAKARHAARTKVFLGRLLEANKLKLANIDRTLEDDFLEPATKFYA